MKAVYFHAAGAIALTFGIAACIPSVDIPSQVETTVPVAADPAPTPAPARTQAPAPAPAPTAEPPRSASAPPPTTAAAVQQPVYDNYLDAPPTPGTWTYADETGETLALFGTSAASPSLIIRCDKASGNVGIARVIDTPATSARVMRIETETAERSIQATPMQGARPMLAAILFAGDPLLDAMAITKGRFAVETQGLPSLYVPAWVEVSRVIEDCR
ncbi:hypothetical protein [Erythrobacter rubeus]|uniref:Lipoprotein n=1 Tax=Erythrobacter rubeus TaxID=2760803 RepID=A0ABR8KT29_9SPHN|nr:hypothetical protein [Erythrobacter rubeus]MBD2841391.1 hypothetical protein [Erythrobacter rubeus]